MKKPRLSLVTPLIIGMVFASSAWKAQTQELDPDPEPLTIQIAPQVLNLASQGGKWVTVHAEIAYSLVNVETVVLQDESGNQVAISSSKADDLGLLVAKFARADVITEFELDAGVHELMLYGLKKEGEEFVGMDEIRVIDTPKNQQP